MASCDDDFSLLDDDHSNSNPNQQHHQILLHHAPRRFTQKQNQIHLPHHQRNDVVIESSSAFHDVNPYDDNGDDDDEDDDNDANRSGIERVRVEKRPRPSSSPAGEYRKDREEWSDASIGCLLDAYSDKFTQLNRGNLRGRDWEEVALLLSERCEKKLSKSVEQCKNKIDNLKKRYKLERHRMSNGGTLVSHWPWFQKMEEIVGYSLAAKGTSDEDRSGSSMGNAVKKPARRYPLVTYSHEVQMNNVKSKATSNIRWRRVVLKISGTALACSGTNNIDSKVSSRKVLSF